MERLFRNSAVQAARRTLGRSCAAAFVIALLGAVSALAQETAATVALAEGQVSILRDGQEWALFASDQVEVGQTIITGDDGFARLDVADGSSFLVFPNSHVVFRTNPGSLSDLIDVFLGRVRIFIQQLNGEPNPHRIFTPTAVISVRGTTFDVAVEEDETTVVSVEEGLVSVAHRLLPRGRETAVAAGQSLVIRPNAPLAKAGVDRVKAFQFAEDVARTLASIWDRFGRGGGDGGGRVPVDPPGQPGGGLPGDEEPPEAPPPPQ